jgi:hypothetical protein
VKGQGAGSRETLKSTEKFLVEERTILFHVDISTTYRQYRGFKAPNEMLPTRVRIKVPLTTRPLE